MPEARNTYWTYDAQVVSSASETIATHIEQATRALRDGRADAETPTDPSPPPVVNLSYGFGDDPVMIETNHGDDIVIKANGRPFITIVNDTSDADDPTLLVFSGEEGDDPLISIPLGNLAGLERLAPHGVDLIRDRAARLRSALTSARRAGRRADFGHLWTQRPEPQPTATMRVQLNNWGTDREIRVPISDFTIFTDEEPG